MSFVDTVMRGAAITVLIFAASFLTLTLLSFFIAGLSPFRQSLLVAVLASVAAALPLIVGRLLHTARTASTNAPPASGGGALLFNIYAALAGLFAVLLTFGVISEWVRL
jgi:hypothetical protein